MIILPSELYSEDMVLHIPYIKKLVDPNLYPQDYLLQIIAPQSAITLYYPFIALIIEISALPFAFTMLALKIFFLFLFFSSTFYLTYRLSKKYSVSVLFNLLMLFSFHIGGTSTRIFEPEILPRTIGTVCILFSFSFFTKGKKWWALNFLVLSLLFHPLTTLYGLLFCVSLMILKKSKSKKRFFIYLFIGSLVMAIIYVFSQQTDPHWLDIIRMRNPYAFADLWSLRSWRNLLLLLIPGCMLLVYEPLWIKKTQLKFLFICGLSTAIVITIFHFLFSVLWPSTFIIQLQLLRFWWYPSVLSLLVASVLLVEIIPRAFFLILVLLFPIIAYLYLTPSAALNKDSWLQVQQWLHQHASPSCKILTPFFSKGFRVTSELPIIGEYKDGALSFYDKMFAFEWETRYMLFKQWENLSDTELSQLQKKYSFSYLVTSQNKYKLFPLVFENDSYRVYKTGSCVNI